MKAIIGAALLALASSNVAAAQGPAETVRIEIANPPSELYAWRVLRLSPADELTRAKTGEVELHLYTPVWSAPDQGGEPSAHGFLITEDGRPFKIQHGAHSPAEAIAQEPDGPIAQAMGLPPGGRPTLYWHWPSQTSVTQAICAPEGPRALAYHEDAGGAVAIVAFRSFNWRRDNVCDRLSYRLNP
jgi:hypothetical protein